MSGAARRSGCWVRLGRQLCWQRRRGGWLTSSLSLSGYLRASLGDGCERV